MTSSRRLVTASSCVAVLLLGIAVAHAGSLTPPASPAATSYTLGDIYDRLTTNEEADEADHPFAPSGSPAASLYTLTQIYDAIPTVEATKVKSGTTYLGVAGSLLPNGGTATSAAVFTGATAHLSGDWTLDIGTLTRACAVSTFDGTTNLVPDAYDGSGNGTNRFCITDSGDALAGDILSGKVAWVDGLAVTGTVADREGDTASTAQAAAGGVNYLTAPAGFYDGDDRVSATDAQIAALDSDITAANIADGITIFGVEGALAAGTDLSDMWNGTSGSFTGGALQFGGVDDYNSNGSPPGNRYSATWTTCNSGNSYCGTGDTGAAKKDENTGLVWSKTINSSGYALDDTGSSITWFAANNCEQTTGSFCTKKTSSKTGCEANTGWYLPNQKQLVQAWIDGAYGNLEPSGSNRTHWSATTNSASPAGAWRVILGQGLVSALDKTNNFVVRCVRPAA